VAREDGGLVGVFWCMGMLEASALARSIQPVGLSKSRTCLTSCMFRQPLGPIY
jgi:hypothetical protein